MLEVEAYLRQRERPSGSPVMRQRWHDLTFLHVALPAETVQSWLPPGLTVDTHAGPDGCEAAWLGLVPFWMSGVRPVWSPAIPWLSAFPETNVRTYVHREGRDPGVWFFSLEAARWLACRLARAWFGLPYYWGGMTVGRTGGALRYRSRRWEGLERPTLDLTVRAHGPFEEAEPGTLEFWLVERYRLYSLRRGALWSGLVHHAPYRTAPCEAEGSQSFLAQYGVPDGTWAHRCFSPGVDVEVFGLTPVGPRG